MGVFPCGSCSKTFPYEKRLKEHLKKDHGIKKDYLVNRQIAEWRNSSVIPTVQAPEKLKECRYCKKEFSPKHLAAHERRCTQKGDVAIVQETQGEVGNVPLGIDATTSAPETQDSIPWTKKGHKVAFHQFLVSRNVPLRYTKDFMDLLNQWMEQCGDVEADGDMLIEKFPQFIDQLSSNWQKQQAFMMYSQFSCYAAGMEGYRHGSIEYKLEGGKAVPIQVKAYISRPRVLPSFQEGDSQQRGRRCRDRKQTEIFNAPKLVKAARNPLAKPVEEDQSTPANMSPQVPISQSLENQNPDTFQIPVDENDGSNHTINNIYSTKPYTMKRGRAIKPDWVDEDGNPRWNDEEDNEEWGNEKSKGKGKGKGKSSKGGKGR